MKDPCSGAPLCRAARVACRSFLLAVGSLLLLCLRAGSARATPSSRIVYARSAGAESCPDEAELRAAVRARLGYDPFFPWADQTIVVYLTGQPRRKLAGQVYRVDATGHAAGVREVTAVPGECGELIRALALAIVMTLDPLYGHLEDASSAVESPERGSERRASEASPQTHDPAGTGAPSGGRPVPEKPAVPSVSVPDGATQWELGLGALSSIGIGPGASVGAAPWARLRHRSQSIALEGRFDFPTSIGSPLRGQAEVSLAGGLLAPCIHYGASLGCPLLLLARYRAEGVDLGQPKRADALFAATGLRLGAELPFAGSISLFFHGDGLAHLTRHWLTISGAPAWRMPIASFTASIGIGGPIP